MKIYDWERKNLGAQRLMRQLFYDVPEERVSRYEYSSFDEPMTTLLM